MCPHPNKVPSIIIGNRNKVIHIDIKPFSKMPESCMENSIVLVTIQLVQVWDNLENKYESLPYTLKHSEKKAE